MKKIMILVFAALMTANLYAQTDSVFVAVAPTKMNVLYVGVDNPIQIGISNLCGQTPSVSIDCGTIKYVGNGMYMVKILTACQVSSIVVSYTVNGQKRTESRKFRVKRAPDPVAKIGRFYSGQKINKNELLSLEGLRAVLDNFDFDLRYSVVSFCISSKSNLDLIPSDGPKFSVNQKLMLKNLKAGETIYISKIQATAVDNIIRTLEDCFYIID